MTFTHIGIPYLIMIVFLALLVLGAFVVQAMRSRRTEADEVSRADDLSPMASARFLLDYVQSPLTDMQRIADANDTGDTEVITGGRMTPLRYDDPMLRENYAPTRPNPRLNAKQKPTEQSEQ